MTEENYDKIRGDIIDALNVADFYLDTMYAKSNRLFWQFNKAIESLQKLVYNDTTGKYNKACEDLIDVFAQYTKLVDEQQLNSKEIGGYVDKFEKYRP